MKKQSNRKVEVQRRILQQAYDALTNYIGEMAAEFGIGFDDLDVVENILHHEPMLVELTRSRQRLREELERLERPKAGA